MKVILAAVTSINGKLTRGDDSDIYKWTSKEDQDFFFGLLSKSKLLVMGSGTYTAVRDKFAMVQKERLRIVMTSTPEKYKDQEVESSLEFSSETPTQLIERLSKKYEEVLIMGAKVHAAFLKEKLVDEIYLTIEPFVFGEGKNLVDGLDFETDLKLESVEKLNDQGTLLLKYKVIR